MKDSVRVAILTQGDSFVLPENIKHLSGLEGVDMVAVVEIDSEGSLMNKKSLFVRGFGLCQVVKIGTVSVRNKILDVIDACFLYRLGWLKSLKSAASVCGADYSCVKNPNDLSTINWLSKLDIDLIVSYSAPCIFKTELLSLPALGCINLHCSLLPKFAGILPSFWGLYEGSENLGATVHRMDSKIDNGSILGQVTVPRPTDLSMFNVIRVTKQAGGTLMMSVVKEIIEGKETEKPNNVEVNNYYSWPSIDQIKEFRRGGGRLI